MNHDNVCFDDDGNCNDGSESVRYVMDDGEVDRVREQRRRQNKQRYGLWWIFFTICNFFVNIFLFSSLKRQKNKRQRTGDGLTNHEQCARTRCATKEEKELDSPVKHQEFNRTTTYSDEYFKAIEDINSAYRKNAEYWTSKEGLSKSSVSNDYSRNEKQIHDSQKEY